MVCTSISPNGGPPEAMHFWQDLCIAEDVFPPVVCSGAMPTAGGEIDALSIEVPMLYAAHVPELSLAYGFLHAREVGNVAVKVDGDDDRVLGQCFDLDAHGAEQGVVPDTKVPFAISSNPTVY